MIKIKTNSKLVKPGDTFVAISGHTVDGHNFIDQAIENGATKIIVEKDVTCNVESIKVKSTHQYLVDYLVSHHSKDFKDLKIVGITGTNGKTTTAFLAYQMLQKLKVRSAYIGTIGFYMQDVHRKLANTTPDTLAIYNLLLEAKEHDCKIVIMEVSSHALDQDRVAGIEFDVAAFTNFTQDHLDYHLTMENYLEVKTRILRYLKPNGKMIVNQDDPSYLHFVDDRALFLGFQAKDYHINSYQFKYRQTEISFKKGKEYKVLVPLICLFNVYNYMMALAIVHELGYLIEDILAISNDLTSPEGRCNIIPVGNKTVIIDFAHTPDAIEKVLEFFEQNKTGKIITVIGSAGDRDALKRPAMGNISARYSDYVIFSEDSPYHEDSYAIIEDLTRDIPTNNYEVELDRKKAVYRALDMAQDGDFVLLLGKGHEDYIAYADYKIHYNDAETVYDYIKEKSLS